MKFKKFIVKVLMVFVMIFSLSSCRAPGVICGKYNLISISGIPGVSVFSYEYNYIILNDDYTYELENKVNGIVTSQKGEWSLNSAMNEITFVTYPSLAQSVTEVYEYNIEAKAITFALEMNSYDVVMVFVKGNVVTVNNY